MSASPSRSPARSRRGSPSLPLARAAALALLCGALASSAHADSQHPLVVGSKVFTESVLLGEIVTQALRDAGRPAEHRAQLGGTRLVFTALESGTLHLYPEYTGTLTAELLARDGAPVSLGDAVEELGRRGLRMSEPLGFSDTYALGMRRERAAALGIRAISELARHSELMLGFSNEFLDREDGWPGLRRAYALPHENVRGLDHDVAYKALAADTLDVIDLYSTDAEIRAHDIVVLEDDRGYFPAYDAVILYRAEVAADVEPTLAMLAGGISVETMTSMNARVELERRTEVEVAAQFLAARGVAPAEDGTGGTLGRIAARTLEHLALVTVSLGAAVLVAVPLGIAAAYAARAGRVILAATGIVQTIPSLALLVFMIPLLGIGAPPAIAALFLYSLLPIVRNTHAGLLGIGRELLDSADALGLPRAARLRRIELPLAARSILAGIKTSAVINVGTATLGALVGAGGYGQPILTGIRLDDVALILEGAVPAALLALLVEGLFDAAERRAVPRGLRAGAKR